MNSHYSTLAPDWTRLDHAFVIPMRRPDVLEESLDEELVLTDPNTGAIFNLNRTAQDVWNACDGTTTTHEVADRHRKAYDVQWDTTLDHVEQLVAAFARSKLLVPSSAG